MQQYGWNGKYTSVDINPDMIQVAKKRLPDAEYLCIDILQERLERTFDYVFCGATIQHKPRYDDAQKYFDNMVCEMFRLANRGVAFDSFSTRVDYRDNDKLYVDPMHLLRLCYSLTSRLVLRNDYRPYEVVVYLYKNESKNEVNIFND